ncbi:hypothetical protein P3X46_002162 [Hevea brasiliensis]|uniref:J domain-containing protein n=1 Tax=Hevea brasiliensis TaxID=3981 RepID=A0ABQ9N4D1_HEVBR|nr:J domain-containing protein required for chloroplast accumulation response 1 [Hevea brasiliensis]KAJ9186613.1 hypothetical protein P3X46_002162 [Hevea brasiliensis]
MNHPISSPKSPCRNSSDIDFNDVFGGPPRRPSIQEVRHGFSESKDSYALRSDEETSSYRPRWSGLSEKPVFGEEGFSRRRYTSDDFFDDIFKGNEYSTSSPRKNNRDPFSSAPGSRVLSPVHPLPPRAEPFASSSVPAQFSLPAKLIKGKDLPTFGSSARNHHRNKDGTSTGISFYSYSPVSRFSSKANQAQGPLRNDVFFQSSLSQAQSLSIEESLNIVKPNEMDEGNDLKIDSNCSEGPSIGNQFHFSIYKWASKGIPLALPLGGGNSSKWKEKFKFERSSSASGRIACEGMAKELPTVIPQDIDCLSSNISTSSDAKSSEIEFDKKENGSLFNRRTLRKLEQVQNLEEAILPKSVSEVPSTHHEDGPGNVIFQNSNKETKPRSVLGTGFSGKIEKKFSVATQEAPKSESKTLRSLLIATDEMTTKNELKESKVKSIKKSVAGFDVSEKVKKRDGKGVILNSEVMVKTNLQGSSMNSRDSLAKNQGKGKVREFVKIFNQEASNKPKFNVGSQTRSSRWKERGKFKTEDDASVTSTQVDEFLMLLEKQHSDTRNNNHKSMEISSGLEDRSAPTAGPISDGSEAIAGDPDDSFQGNILIKELPRDGDELPQVGDNQEDIQVINAKIWKWSNGKEGSIRSLLSTLQYVLWPESGWKPVPLVDIIEGNAVKRSYQKALLSLHPDKLQQKGAASHQKYIAEKVFDILQEAWTHFNSLDPV